MKLFVIILCLMSERYLTHQFATYRKKGFDLYEKTITPYISALPISFRQPLVMLVMSVLIPTLICGLIYFLLGPLGFGFVGLLIQLAVFYWCLGPNNPFYFSHGTKTSENVLKHYFTKMNTELFAPIFWFILGGPVVMLAYRMLALYSENQVYKAEAQKLLGYFNWLPIRLEAMLYLFVGHFQEGMKYFSTQLMASPVHNNDILVQTALLALKDNQDTADITMGERMVEHALIVLLVFVALLTLMTWI